MHLYIFQVLRNILSTEMHSMTENQTQSNFFLNKTATIDKINKNITAPHNMNQCVPANRTNASSFFVFVLYTSDECMQVCCTG